MFEEIKLTRNEVMAESSAGEGSQAQARTLAGKALALTFDLVSAPGDARSQTQRGATADMLAEVALDTLVMVPGARARAVALRAGLLLKPEATGAENARTLGLELVEGMALNRLSRMALPGGKTADVIHNRFQSPLAREAATHLVFGAGLGLTKSSLDERTWVNKEGNIDLEQGLLNVAKATTVGSLLNVPAGFIGTRVAGESMKLAARKGLDPRLGLTLSGASSGYAAGSVLGGVETAIAGGTYEDIVKGMHQSGLAGAFGGGLGMSLIGSRARHTELQNDSHKGAASPESKAAGDLRAAEQHATSLKDFPDKPIKRPPKLDDKLYDELSYPREFLPQEASLADRLRMLGPYKIEQQQRYVAVPGAERMTFADFAEYQKKAVRTVTEATRVYNYRGTEIRIPDTYASLLDRFLAERIQNQQNREAGLPPAEVKGEPNALANKIHPVDILATLDVPDSGLVKTVDIQPNSNPFDPYFNRTEAWLKTNYGGKFESAAVADSRTGTVTWFNMDRGQPLPGLGRHEWGHLLKDASASDSRLFDLAAHLEKDGFYLTNYARRNNHENFAEHTMGLLDNRVEAFWQTAHEAPIRASIIARSLAISMGQTGNPGPMQATFGRRLAYVEKHVLPQAQAELVRIMKEGTSRNAARAAELLGKLGDQNHIDMLTDTARNTTDRLVRDRAFDAVVTRAEERTMTRRNYKFVRGTEDEAGRLSALLSLGTGDSKATGLALGYLKGESGADALAVADIIRTGTDIGKNTVADLAEAVTSIDTPAVRKKAFEHALLLAETPETRTALSLEVIDRTGALAERVIAELKANPDAVKELSLYQLSHRQRSYIELSRLSDMGTEAGHAAKTLLKDDKIFDYTFKKTAFDVALEHAASPAERVAIAQTALHRYHGLMMEATKVLAESGAPEARNTLSILKSSPKKEVAALATEGLKNIYITERMSNLAYAMETGDPSRISLAATSLASTRDTRAIPLLLRAYAEGPVEVRPTVSSLLNQGWAPSMAKFHARELSRTEPGLAPTLRQFLQNR